MEEKEEGGGWIRGHLGSPGRVGSVFDECRDDQLVALPGSNMKGRVPVLVLTINVSSYTHNNMQLHIVHHSYTVHGTKKTTQNDAYSWHFSHQENKNWRAFRHSHHSG